MSFSAEELERYARHIMLREIGGMGQRRLAESRVAVVGAGGLGSPALMYLAAAGVGCLRIIDDDVVSLSNLQRQILHATDRVGGAKTESAVVALSGINPHVAVDPLRVRLDARNARDILQGVDLVLDGSDSFETRTIVNATCAGLSLPLVSGAMSQWEGQLSVFDPARAGPCYACVFSDPPAPGQAPSCAEAGVMGALAGVMGSMMAGEAIKYLTGAGRLLRGDMLIYDALWGETRRLALKPRADCAVCRDIHRQG